MRAKPQGKWSNQPTRFCVADGTVAPTAKPLSRPGTSVANRGRACPLGVRQLDLNWQSKPSVLIDSLRSYRQHQIRCAGLWGFVLVGRLRASCQWDKQRPIEPSEGGEGDTPQPVLYHLVSGCVEGKQSEILWRPQASMSAPTKAVSLSLSHPAQTRLVLRRV